MTQQTATQLQQTPHELNLAAKALIQQGKFAAANDLLHSSLALEKNPVAYRYLGVISRLGKDFPPALTWFEDSLKLAPEDPATLQQVAECYFDMGNLTQATAFYAFAIRHDPSNLQYLERFVAMSQRATFVNYSDVVEQAVVTCLQNAAINSYPLQALWFNTFLLNPAFQPLYNPKAGWTKKLFGAAPSSLPPDVDFSPLLTPFFLLGLRHLTIFNLEFEDFLQRLRRTLLALPARDDLTLLAAALSHYCYNNEYISVASPAEKAEVEKLRQRLAAPSSDAAYPAMIYACFNRLYMLDNGPAVAQALKDNPLVADVIKLQLLDHFELQEIRKTIPAITEIENEISVKVRAQYEESPYPMWVKLPMGLRAEKPAERLLEKKSQILVAGCGTGHEALQYATMFPQAEVLAIDLSLTSMAYAMRKAAEFNIGNISFRQADILKIGTLGRKFDCVVSGGVLHHMQDMYRGWEAITGVLAAGGVMKIGLYSRLARRDLLAAHGIIKKGHQGLDLDGMRAFRANSDTLLDKKLVSTLSRFEDYYHLSMYRDMMFHVQERNLGLDEIGDMLERLGLEFMEFSISREVKASFAATYPADSPGGSLKNWQQFEKNNPDTFSACYIFWCQKKQG